MSGLAVPMAVVATAALTPVGANVAQTAASLRAGITGLAEHTTFRGRVGQPGWELPEPATVAEVPFGREREGAPRLIELLLPVLEELLRAGRVKRSDLSKTALLLVLPRIDDAVRAWGLADGLLPRLLARAGLAVHHGQALPEGHAGGLAALPRAAALLKERQVDRVILAGADTYLPASRLAQLDDAWRLRSARNADGLIPGEAAAAVLLEVARGGAGGRPIVHACGVGHEPQPSTGDRSSTAIGLAAALGAVAPSPSRWVLCDLNGESYRAYEWSLCTSRLSAQLGRVERLVHPAASIGDVGAASGPLLIATACAGFERGHARSAEAVVWAASDDGLRAAARIRGAAD